MNADAVHRHGEDSPIQRDSFPADQHASAWMTSAAVPSHAHTDNSAVSIVGGAGGGAGTYGCKHCQRTGTLDQSLLSGPFHAPDCPRYAALDPTGVDDEYIADARAAADAAAAPYSHSCSTQEPVAAGGAALPHKELQLPSPAASSTSQEVRSLLG